MNINEALGTVDHATSLAFAHPHQQAAYEAALSALHFGYDSLHLIGLDWTVADDRYSLLEYVIAAKSKNGAKAQEMGIEQNTIGYLGLPVDLYEVPGPIIFSVPLDDCYEAAVVHATYTSCDEMGYGDWHTAHVYIDRICDTLTEADNRVTEVSRAVKTLRKVANMVANRPEMRRTAGRRRPTLNQ